jgi:hypothetical protein
MLEDAMADNLAGISPVSMGAQETAGDEDQKKSVTHFMRQNGLFPEEGTGKPRVAAKATPLTGKHPGPQYID